MVLPRWSRAERPTEETLGLLNNRLDSATYEEDKLDALSELYEQSLNKPAEVGACCLSSVVASIESTDDISYQTKILENVFRTQLKKGLVDQVCKDKRNIGIFTKRSPAELSSLLDSIDSDIFYRFLAQDLDISAVLTLLLRNGYLQTVKRFLQSEEHLCSRVVFEGFLEMILERVVYIKRNRSRAAELGEHYDLLLCLLTASISSQDYFIKADLVQTLVSSPPVSRQDIEISSAILNPLSRSYKLAQQQLCTPNVVTKALEMKLYDFVYSLFNDNNGIFDLLLENYFDVPSLLRDSESSVAALGILENILRSSANVRAAYHDQLASCRSYQVNTLLYILGFHHFDMNEILDQDLRNGRITSDLIIFIVFTRDSIQDIAQYLNWQLFEANKSDLCLLLHLLHGTDLKMAAAEIKLRMARLRQLLCRESMAVESINEMLINTIGEMIKEHTYPFPKKDYLVRKPNAVYTETVSETTQPGNEPSTDVNSKIKGLFSIFKPKDNEKKSFDL